MKITKSKYQFLLKHCTCELLSIIPNIDVVDNKDKDCNEFEITDYLSTNVPIYEIMKIMFVLSQSGGTLLYDNVITQFAVVCRMLDDIRLLDITTYWYNNKANGVLPVYDLGGLTIPQILPKFVATQRFNYWIIEKLQFGNYIPMDNERYYSQVDAEEAAKELNRQQ